MAVRYDEFSGSCVVVSGAASGIGLATARAFLDQGAIVAALDIDEQGLAALSGESANVLALPVDVTDERALHVATDIARHEAGAPRVLVNNAGVDARCPVEEMTLDAWHRSLALNLDHHFILCQRMAEPMSEAGGGSMVNLSSTAFMKLAANMTAYHASKAGIIGLTKGLAREFGPRGIRVNAIAPGRVVTERVRGGVLTPEWEAETKALQCFPRLIEPADIAAGVLWLASSAAAAVTGQTLVMDGGVV